MAPRQLHRIGILGGTFNPPHLGHLLIAQDALELAGLDLVKFVPAAVPPHKKSANLVAAADRLRMLRRAVRGQPRFAVDDLELRRGGPSYTVDTVLLLQRRYPRATLYFIVGGDSLSELPSWRDADRLVRLCRFLVVERAGGAGHAAQRRRLPVTFRRRLRYRWLTGHPSSFASRDIRARIARGRPIRYLVPETVFRYIQRHKLYQ